MNTLRCENIRKAFDGVVALDGIDLSFPLAGIVAIIGPNGAGKTTLLSIITGFLRPDAGKVILGQQEISRQSPNRVAHLGISRTFQDLRLIRRMSVLENVMLARPGQRGEGLFQGLFRFGVAAEETKNRQASLAILEFVGLEKRAQELAGELSYGQQKLLALAVCLATEATVLLLDEPVAGVHTEMAHKIASLLLDLKRKGKLVVFIEHDMDMVRDTADWVIVMDEGRIIAQGPPAEVLQQPSIMEAYIG